MFISVTKTPLYAGYVQVYKDGFLVDNCIAACNICGWVEYFCMDKNNRLLLTESNELVLKKDYGKVTYYIMNSAPKNIMDLFVQEMKNKTCECEVHDEDKVSV
jgi:hypothetical protein